jgi:hypothetical protein
MDVQPLFPLSFGDWLSNGAFDSQQESYLISGSLYDPERRDVVVAMA